MQLSKYEDITQENIIFNKAKEYKVKDSNIKYKRIKIEVNYPNGKKGPLVVETPLLFSFGVSENKDQKTGKLNGYSVPVCLWDRDGVPNKKELSFFEVLNNIISLCQKHLEVEYGPDLASSMPSPFYFKTITYTDKKGREKTKKDDSSAPILYAKLIYSEKTKKILSLFKGKGGRDLNPLKYLNQYCNVKLALIIEGIFISKNVTSLQIKVHECYVKQLEPRKSLLTTIEEKSSESDIDSDSDEINDKVVDNLLLSDEKENE